MKSLGWGIAACGVIYLIIAFNMDVSVSSYGPYGGGEVANLELMARRQNHVIVAALITLIGVLIGVFAPPMAGSNPAPTVVTGAPQPEAFEGERDLTSDAYRLWLARTYDISRNEVFERFVIGDEAFDTLDEALAKGHAREIEREAKARAAVEERQRKQEESRQLAEAARERSEAEWHQMRPKVIAGAIIVTIMAVVGIYLLIEQAKEDRAEALALKQASIAELKEQYGFELPLASVRQITEAGEYDTYRCGDANAGTLVTFESTGASEMLAPLDAALGEHETEYEYEGSGEWIWSKDDKRFILASISSGLTLCIIEAV